MNVLSDTSIKSRFIVTERMFGNNIDFPGHTCTYALFITIQNSFFSSNESDVVPTLIVGATVFHRRKFMHNYIVTPCARRPSGK